jgi:hypothetical protein
MSYDMHSYYATGQNLNGCVCFYLQQQLLMLQQWLAVEKLQQQLQQQADPSIPKMFLFPTTKAGSQKAN